MLDVKVAIEEGLGKVGGSRVLVTISESEMNGADGAEVDPVAPKSSAVSSEA